MARNKFLPKRIILVPVFFIFIFLYNLSKNQHDKNTTYSFTELDMNCSTILTLPSEIPKKWCYLSLKESDDWFCESDDDWKRRKTIHHNQDRRNRHSNERHSFFQNNWESTIQCALEQRIGDVGDGGKWVCDIHKIQSSNCKPLIYSLGSHNDFKFEEAIRKQLPNAEIHTFDMDLYECPSEVCTFHQVRFGDSKQAGTKSLAMVIDELGHRKRQIDILKVDIEGSEYDLFNAFFTSQSNNTIPLPYIRQILVEIHLDDDQGEAASIRVHELFELFRANHFTIFHKEVNLYDSQDVFEYGLIHLNRAFFHLI